MALFYEAHRRAAAPDGETGWAVTSSEDARSFLKSLGLTEPDPVDDVVRNVLPKYAGDEVDVDGQEYETDIRRIVAAFGTDSKTQRAKLVSALREARFVMVVDQGDQSKWIDEPGNVYLATDSLKELFSGVDDVVLVDDSYECLRGEKLREMLEACGAAGYLQPVAPDSPPTMEELREIRLKAGCEACTSQEPVEDYTLRGLKSILETLAELPSELRTRRAELLWEALGDVEDRCGASTFSGTYRWTYFQRRSAIFDAYFVRILKKADWVPGPNGDLSRPELVLFDSLGWKPNPFLLTKIRFKPPVIEDLAKESGIEAAALDLLKKLGLTRLADLQARLGSSVQGPPGTNGDDDKDGRRDSEKKTGGGGDSKSPVKGDSSQKEKSQAKVEATVTLRGIVREAANSSLM